MAGLELHWNTLRMSGSLNHCAGEHKEVQGTRKVVSPMSQM
jgi:hypothetical protein